MRNLKRALSLGLTAAMISGLMVMGSSAASSSYTDVADTDNVEAIEVLKAVGIMVGDDNGDFNPDENVSRNEMAVVMSNLMEYNVATYADTSPFTDVPDWAEPYVAACYTNGITSGYDATTFGGDDDVTTAQAALMVMKALGYFQYESDFGSDWQLETISQGNDISLFDGVESGVQEAMTRNDVAQLVLNALESGTVRASTSGSISVGDITIVNDVDYNYVTSNEDYAQAISDLRASSSTSSTEGYIVELGERLYQGDLEKEDSTDDFMRPATMWTYESGEIGTFSDEADASWTTQVSYRDLYNAAGSAAYNNYTWYVYRNGEDVDDMVGVDGSDVLDNNRTSTDRWNNTGYGVLTEVYVDSTEREVVVSLVDTFVAEVTSVDDNGDGEYTVNISYKSARPSGSETEFITEQEIEDDSIVLVTIGQGEIQSMAVAETVEGTVDAVRNNSYVRIDGTTYYYNRAYCVDDLYNSTAGLTNLDDGEAFVNPTTDNDVTIYLDAYGYAVAIEGADDTIEDYLYVTGIDQAYGDYSVKVVFGDGTQETIDIDEVDGNDAEAEDNDNRGTDYDATENNLIVGRVYKWSQSGSAYDLESSEGEGDFTKVIWAQDDETGYGEGEIERDRARITGGTDVNGESTTAIADDDTVYIHYEDDRMWTGYTEVSSMNGIYGAAVKDDGVVTVMFIEDSLGSSAEDDDFVYISDTEATEFTEDGDTLYEYEGSYVNADGSLEEGTFIASSDLGIEYEGLYQVTSRDSSDYATDVELLVNIETGEAENDDVFDNYATRAQGGLLMLEGDSYDIADTASDGDYSVNSDTFYMVVELKGDNDDTDDVYQGDIGDIETDEDGRTAVFVLTVDDDSDETPLAEMVLVIVPDEDSSSSGGGSSSSSDDTDDVSNGDATLTVEIGDIELTAESVRISSTGNLSYTFGVDTDAEQITYDWAVYIDGTRVDRGSDVLADVIDGEVDGTVSDLAYDEGDEVEIIISDVKVVDETEEPEEETYTLTLSGDDLTADGIAVYEGNVRVTGSEMLSGTEYEITEGAVVTITGVTVTAGTYVVDGVTITATSDRLTFTMSGDFTLDSVPGSDAAVYTVTIGEGITLTDAEGNPISGTVEAGTVITVESETGTYFTKTASDDSKAISSTPTSDSTTFTVSESTIVYAASKVTLNNASATYERASTSNGNQNVSSGYYVAVGTELTLTATTGSAVIEGTTTGEAISTYTVGTEDVTLSGAWEVELTDVTATIDNTAIGSYVANGTAITVAADEDAGTSVIQIVNGLKYATSAVTSITVNSDLELGAAVKVTVNGGATLSYDGSRGSVSITGTTVYVLSGTVLYTSGTTIQDSDGNIETTPADGEVSFTVGNQDITISSGT